LDGNLVFEDTPSTLTGTSGTINLDGNFIQTSDLVAYKYNVVTLTGTAENPFIINGIGGFGDRPVWKPIVTFNYVELTDLTMFYFWESSEFNVQNCLFDSFSTGTFRIYSNNENKDTIFRNCKFIDCTASVDALQFGTSSETYTGSGTGIREISNCTFKDCSKIYLASGVVIKGNILNNTAIYQYGTKEDVVIQNNLYSFTNGTSKSGVNGQFNINNNYCYSTTPNMFWFTSPMGNVGNPDDLIFEYNIIEHTGGGDGQDIFVPMTEATDGYYRYNLIIGDSSSGVFINATSSTARASNVYCYNNTLYYSQGVYGSLGRNENAGEFTGTDVIFKNNLCYNTGSLGDNRVINLIVNTTTDQMTYVGYNALYNYPQTVGAYYDVTITDKSFGDAGLGLGDIYTDPAFVDSTRNLATWDTYNGGNGTASNAITEMLKLNDSDFDDNYTVAKLNAWVKAGFAPTNIAYATASDIGSYVGAVEPVEPVISNSIFNFKIESLKFKREHNSGVLDYTL